MSREELENNVSDRLNSLVLVVQHEHALTEAAHYDRDGNGWLTVAPIN